MFVDPTSSSAQALATETGSSGSANQSVSLDQTFMTLLMAELKTQDPLSPMDPTQMVGQMVSLNQLSELIQINQAMQSITGTSTTSNAQGEK